MYSRILVVVDGSEIALRALHEALTLAKGFIPDCGSSMRLTWCPTGGEVTVGLETYRQSCLDAGQEVLDRAVALAREAAVPVEAALVEMTTPQPRAALLEEAKRWSADLIVLSTHGRTGLRRLLTGSAAEGVVRNAPVPVLLIRGVETTA